MFTFLSWDSLNELLSELVMVALLCVALFIWAARMRAQDEQQRRTALRPPGEAPPGPAARPPDGVVSAVRPLVEVDSPEDAPGNDQRP
jgi:hypothetical protein